MPEGAAATDLWVEVRPRWKLEECSVKGDGLK